jgi:hypothetical protein
MFVINPNPTNISFKKSFNSTDFLLTSTVSHDPDCSSDGRKGLTETQIADKLIQLEADDTDDDLEDVEADPEPEDDDGIVVTEEVVYENEVIILLK